MPHPFPLCLSLLSAIASAGAGPDLAQVQRAVGAAWGAEMEGAERTGRVALSLFAPRVDALGWCRAVAGGAFECSVGIRNGMEQAYRMMRFAPQGDGWRWQPVQVEVPVPSVDELAPQWNAWLDETIAATPDPTTREAMRTEVRGMRLAGIEDCELAREDGRLQCWLVADDGADRRSILQVDLRPAGGRWQLHGRPR